MLDRLASKIKRYKRPAWLNPRLILLIIPLYTLFIYLGPSYLSEKLSDDRWRLLKAVFIEDVERPFLLVAMKTNPKFKQRPFHRMATIDIADGTIIEERVNNDYIFRFYGVSPRLMWLGTGIKLRRRIRYRNPTGVWGYSLPDLKLACDLDRQLSSHEEIRKVTGVAADGMDGLLRITSSDGERYEFDPASGYVHMLSPDPPPLQPTLIHLERDCSVEWGPASLGDEYITEGLFPCNANGRGRSFWPNGDRLLVHQDREGEMGKLIVSRVTRTDRVVWHAHEDGIFTAPKKKYDVGQLPGRRVKWSMAHDGVLYLITEQGAYGDELDIVALDARDGTLVWRRTFT